jgi:hypothetical protein
MQLQVIYYKQVMNLAYSRCDRFQIGFSGIFVSDIYASFWNRFAGNESEEHERVRKTEFDSGEAECG